MQKEEEEWLTKELAENTDALLTMRSFLPLPVADLTITELFNMARSEGRLD